MGMHVKAGMASALIGPRDEQPGGRVPIPVVSAVPCLTSPRSGHMMPGKVPVARTRESGSS